MILYMYVALGQGRQPLGDKLLMSTESPYHFAHLLQIYKKKCFEVQFYIFFFHVSPYVYSPGAGADNPLGTNFDDNRNAFSLCPYVACFKIISSKSDFVHNCNDFIHVYSPVARAENPLGTNFWCQQKVLITSTIYCKSLSTLILYIFFNVFPHVFSPGAGADPLGTKFWCKQEGLITLPI